LKYIIFVLALVFSINASASGGWKATTIGIYGAGSPSGPSIREWDKVLLDYDYLLSSPDHESIYSFAQGLPPSLLVGENKELTIWEHPALPNKAYCMGQGKDFWFVKLNSNWSVAQKSEYTKFKIKSEWNTLCHKKSVEECTESLKWKDVYVLKVTWVMEWKWKRIAVHPTITTATSEGALRDMDNFIPQDARNVFVAYDYLYYQTQEKVKTETMTRVE